MIGVREDVYTVRYHPPIDEAVFAVRKGWRSKRDNTPETNHLIRLRCGPSAAKNRLDALWYRAMQRAGIL